MRDRLRRWLSSPRFVVGLTAAVLAIGVQSGELGSADTMHRLQAAHSFWTSEPAVFPNEYPEFGAHGRGGKLYGWYGIGQSLPMLPADIIGTYIENLPIFADYKGVDPTVRNIFVTYTINTLINVLTALVCMRFLRLLEFGVRQSVAGVLALLFCTTHLHYTQNMMENNYIFLLTLTGFAFQYQWLRTASRLALVIGSAALGLDLLTRLTTALDAIAVFLFLSLISRFENTGKQELWNRCRTYASVAVPLYAFFLLMDRAYQFYRFGTWTDTYLHYFTLERRLQDPNLPVNYPWETPFHEGFFGALFSPEKSIFLFDPLIVLSIILAAVIWKHLSGALKAYLGSVLLLLFCYVCFYARYTVWSGNFAWGDRYVSTAVELAAFISVPILVKHRAALRRPIWSLGLALIAIALVIQISSLAFWMPLEIYQADDLGHPRFVIWLRFKNIAAFALGKMNSWGLITDSMSYDQWDYQHITTWNFLPFVLKRIGEAPGWIVQSTLILWWCTVAGLVAIIARLASLVRQLRTQ
jgi:hypothetical protein